MERHALILVRGFLVMAVAALVLFGATLTVDLWRSGLSPSQLLVLGPEDARNLVSLLSRTCNQLMAVVFTTVAIAVPLTANMYSLKFLEFFVKDRVNATMLSLVVLLDLNAVLVGATLKEHFVPVVGLAVELTLLGTAFALLFPYVYYVFRFLHPNTLLQRLAAECGEHLREARGDPEAAREQRAPAGEALEHIANVCIRSVDRLDRSTAMEGVLVLEGVARDYWRIKAELPATWFEAEPSSFLGFSSKAVDEISAGGGWFEMKVFRQLRLVLSAAVPKVHDVTSAVARALRHLATDPAVLSDRNLREMATEYFNTFVRLSITRGDARSVFVVLDHYRQYAEALLDAYPEEAEEIAFYLRYYGDVAYEQELPFVVETLAHDLGMLVTHAWDKGAKNREALLGELARFSAPPRAREGVRKAQAIVATHLLSGGHRDAARVLQQAFAGMSPDEIQHVRDDLLAIRRPKYWEISERRLNMHWVEPAERPLLVAFLADAAAGR